MHSFYLDNKYSRQICLERVEFISTRTEIFCSSSKIKRAIKIDIKNDMQGVLKFYEIEAYSGRFQSKKYINS